MTHAMQNILYFDNPHKATNDVLEEMYDVYTEQIFQYAKREFYRVILPWLKKYHLEFVAGNGTFYLGITKETPAWFKRKYCNAGYCPEQLDRDKLPNRIYNVLCGDVKGMNNALGSLMQNCEENK